MGVCQTVGRFASLPLNVGCQPLPPYPPNISSEIKSLTSDCTIAPTTVGLSVEINEDLAGEEVEGDLNGSKDSLKVLERIYIYQIQRRGKQTYIGTRTRTYLRI